MTPQQLANTPGAQAVHQLLAQNGINPSHLSAQQIASLASTPPHAQAKSIAAYMATMQSHHGKQIGGQPGMPNVPNPANQGSPMVQQAPDGSTLNTFYNAPEIGGAMRPGPPGNNGQGAGSNHALQDYQMQLMLLEQQNKKRLMMARQEQDNLGGSGMPRDGPPGPGPNGQFPDTSPQAMRSGASPNPGDQMKRGTPQMNNSGIPSPVPEGGQSRDSPNPAMNFMSNQVDPSMAPHFFKGMEGNMAGAQAQMNGMRPPSSHPGQPFNQQQMMAARAAQGQGQQWQPGPNGQMVGQGMPQNPQGQGTPQARAMPPPSAPAGAAANANNRTTASPQSSAAAPPTPNQGTKAAPKKKETKASKSKAAQKNKAAAANAAGATPAADGDDSAQPATPMTPSFNKAASNQSNAAPATTAPVASAPAAAAPVQGDLGQNGLGADNYMVRRGDIDVVNISTNNWQVDFPGMEFANPLSTGDVLNDFDFDSFLHDNEGNTEAFDFNGTFPSMENHEIGAE